MNFGHFGSGVLAFTRIEMDYKTGVQSVILEKCDSAMLSHIAAK